METITTSDAAILLGASSRTVNRLIVAGTIPAVQLGDDPDAIDLWRANEREMEDRRMREMGGNIT